jgi:hypothetical protein
VELRRVGAGFELVRNGQPFFVRGVGGTASMEKLVEFGGNAVRTWDAEGIGPMLDEAHRLGVAVQAGIWLEHERHGHDYDDAKFRRAQLDKVRRLVLEHRDHPALLTWGVGNEVELGGDLGKALRAIEDAAAIIKELDPYHPTVAVIAEIGEDKAARIRRECPSIDLIGVNSYGGISSVGQRLLEQGYDGAYLITEFGTLGHWEVGATAWGAPIEQTSGEKADFLRAGYAAAVAGQHPGRCVGSFAFLWGNKQETTATWFGLVLETGETTESADVLSEFWTGRVPERRAPRVTAIRAAEGVDVGAVRAGGTFGVRVDASDLDGDGLTFEWHVVEESRDRRSGGDAEAVPDAADSHVDGAEDGSGVVHAPKKPGAYRVFVTVRDGTGRAGTANLPIRVVE